ncbi:hypothetical protein C8R47DRAFT_1067289 [Mycena vitilis]|nr:hypothetical protein C8R47DRAFT_1067289 [Mycena vitilis]
MDIAVREEEAAAAALRGGNQQTTQSTRTDSRNDSRTSATRANDTRSNGRSPRSNDQVPRSRVPDPSKAAYSTPDSGVDRAAKTVRPGDSKSCFTCGGTDHFAKDKKCPRYSEQAPFRERTRVAAQRVVIESYSDEDSSPENEDAFLSDEDNDTPRSPDLDELIAMADERDIRLNAMRDRPVEVDAQDEEVSHDGSAREAYSTTRLGNYNPGPECVVCLECSDYTICAHLANVGQDAAFVALPPSPVESSLLIPPTSSASDEGEDLNWLGDPDFAPGIIIDITYPQDPALRSAEEEILAHEQDRHSRGLRALTALEYDSNLNWLKRFRDYSDPSEIEDTQIEDYAASSLEELRADEEYGPRIRAEEALNAERAAQLDEARIQVNGPGATYHIEPAQARLRPWLGHRAPAHELNLRAQDRLAQSVITRRLCQAGHTRLEEINRGYNACESGSEVEEIWNNARQINIDSAGRLSYNLMLLREERARLVQSRDAALRISQRRLVHDSGRTWEPRSLPPTDECGISIQIDDEASLWAEMTPFTNEELYGVDLTGYAGRSAPALDPSTASPIWAELTPFSSQEIWAVELPSTPAILLSSPPDLTEDGAVSSIMAAPPSSDRDSDFNTTSSESSASPPWGWNPPVDWEAEMRRVYHAQWNTRDIAVRDYTGEPDGHDERFAAFR